MTTPADFVMVRLQTYLNLPLVQRCREIAALIDESSTTDLQHVFPVLVDSIFGVTDNVGWGLHSINLKRHQPEYEMMCAFLGPQGPIFSLCYKLLPDCYLKYKFPLSYLPSKIRLMLEDGVIPPFYSDKIRVDQATRLPSALFMNPFEYYIFYFAHHLTNPWLQLHQEDNVWVNWETIYVQLAHTYLDHFLPRDNSPVQPIIGPYVKTPPRKLMQSPDSKRLQTPRLLRTSILSPGLTSPMAGVPQQQCLPQVWRSETVVQVFLDFWLEYTEEQELSHYHATHIPGTMPYRHSIHSGEHIRLVRGFIKTLHEFANSAIGDTSAMDELKRVILPSVQGKIYIFLRKAIHHWPLDSSFRLILEAWLSFIQPWRYVPGPSYISVRNVQEEERGKIIDETRWLSFVASNLLAYTAIYQQLQPRFMRTDLVAPKNALMLFRVTKVLAQPKLARMLFEVEASMDDARLTRGKVSTNQWSAAVRQQILELEGPTYQYVPMFSPATISQVLQFLSTIKQAHLTATSLVDALEKRRTSRRFILMVWEFFYGDDYSSDDISLEERRRVPGFLANAQQQLMDIFQIKPEDIPKLAIAPDQEYRDSILSTSICNQSEMDLSLDSSRPGVYLQIQERRQNCRYIEYMGDPELQPVRTHECAFLVRLFFQLCNYINTKYQQELNAAYNRRDIIGRLTRRLLQPPTVVKRLPKKSIAGFSSSEEIHIHPRLSLRAIASHSFLSFACLGIFISWIFGYGVTAFPFLACCVWIMSVLAIAAVEPWFGFGSHRIRPEESPFLH
ncbi:sphingomyelin phosphodiesterase 4 [Neodiprion lecontei]|uniref:Sphingomyelin phosphodiesterase 4 n=1 Tax=Neodiprion lecontei TaxID=441921 RepID=A0A6J0C4G5_NEOLC|nr:sphingomyelin phosphodiesterase 4 [Neodiprion lecontei]